MTFSNFANAIRVLSMEAIQKAKSGHPGAPLGMAEIAETLWRNHLNFNPKNPQWCNRDRFVLSNGHASMLLYSLLHLSGYDLSIDDIKNFRQWNSKTPGHPEVNETPGVETTTGPLGQGIVNAVGMALAEKILAAKFNRPNFEIVKHKTYVFVGDGCLMEGISHEACSLAGTLQLGNLIVFWDNNGISIDGNVKDWFSENIPQRFKSYGWNVIENIDGHNTEQINAAILSAKNSQDNKPTLICCKTIIGNGSPNKAGSESCHGAPLGNDEINNTKQNIGWFDKYPESKDKDFYIPDEIYQNWTQKSIQNGKDLENQWQNLYKEYAKKFPDLAKKFEHQVIQNELLPADFESLSQKIISQTRGKNTNIATRKASQNVLEFLVKDLDSLFGGSAELASSNLTLIKDFSKPLLNGSGDGNYCYYGVREFAMTAIANGILLHGGLLPYTATFLMFSDYARNAIRMAALMKLPQIMVYTHDSIGLGEDGPTHQPIEQIPSLRLIPNLNLWRPADATETALAWISALQSKTTPTILALSRQNLPTVTQNISDANILQGGYVLKEVEKSENSAAKKIVISLIATGSEVSLSLQVAEELEKNANILVRVISMPCSQIFDKQSSDYQAEVLGKNFGKNHYRFAIEAAEPTFWWKYLGCKKRSEVIGIDHFGASAPAEKLFDEFGFSVSKICQRILQKVK